MKKMARIPLVHVVIIMMAMVFANGNGHAALLAFKNPFSTSTKFVAKNNGAKIRLLYFGKAYPGWLIDAYKGYTLEWSGGVDSKGYANGLGVESWFRPNGTKYLEIETEHVSGYRNGSILERLYAENGKVVSETSGSYARGYKEGVWDEFRFELGGRTLYRLKLDYSKDTLHGTTVWFHTTGFKEVTQWNRGQRVSKTQYLADGSVYTPKPTPKPAPAPQSSGPSDSELLGGLFAIGGIAGGDAAVSAAGVQMIQGDDAGAVKTLQRNWEKQANESGKPASGSSQPAAASSRQPAPAKQPPPARVIADKPDLIREYKLDRYRGSTDHISYYISAADKALESYRKTGEERYYTQHRDYADTALQFHRQTSTKGTRIGK